MYCTACLCRTGSVARKLKGRTLQPRRCCRLFDERRGSHETLLKHVTAADVYVDRCFGKIAAVNPDDAGSGYFVYMHGVTIFLKLRNAAVYRLQFSRG